MGYRVCVSIMFDVAKARRFSRWSCKGFRQIGRASYWMAIQVRVRIRALRNRQFVDAKAGLSDQETNT